jgi:hypothetical protein
MATHAALREGCAREEGVPRGASRAEAAMIGVAHMGNENHGWRQLGRRRLSGGKTSGRSSWSHGWCGVHA